MARTSSSSLLFFTFTFLSSLSFLPIPSLSFTTDTFAFGGCTQDRYVPGSPYESNLNSLLTSLVNSAAYSSYNNYTVVGSSPQDVVYGLYQCRGDLSMMDCARCVSRAVSQLGDLCLQICGGALQLEGCYVKYDNTALLGVEDKTMVSEKCGPSVEYDTDAMNLRDAVLSGLARTSGPYRVGGSGNVQGLAQCVGGLSIGECQDCVSEAIERLKSDCGIADYGDMFLGKCYVRYTTGGPQVHSKSHKGKSTNKVKKLIANIAGQLPGVAWITSFLAFIVKKLKRVLQLQEKQSSATTEILSNLRKVLERNGCPPKVIPASPVQNPGQSCDCSGQSWDCSGQSCGSEIVIYPPAASSGQEQQQQPVKTVRENCREHCHENCHIM